MAQNYFYPSSASSANPANGTTGSSAPTTATEVAGVDGSNNLRALKVSSAGVLSVDGSAVTQPVSGTFWQATQPVSGTFWQATQPISGTVTVNALTNSSVVKAQLQDNSGAAVTLGQQLAAASLPVVLTAAQITTLTPPTTVTANQGSNNATPWNMNAAQLNGVTPLMGNGVTGTGSLRVTLASDTTSNSNPFLVNPRTSATGTITSVAGSATSVTILASNASRKGMALYNESSAILYLALTSSAASLTAYTVQIPANTYYELPAQMQLYTGQITGIWASATGNARVTELS